jgi:hypothetical protein
VIHLLAYEVQDLLAKKKFPIKVVYGPEAFARESDTTLIVFHREGEADIFPDATSPGRNPRNYSNRAIGFAVVVFAKSSKPNARRQDHEVLCDVYVNAVVCALAKACSARSNGLAVSSGHLLTRAEREGSTFERFPGVAYELKCSLVQSVQDFDFDGAGEPTVQIASVSTEANVSNLASGDENVTQYAGTIDVQG